LMGFYYECYPDASEKHPVISYFYIELNL
jgi:hypothetical protein